MFHSQHRQDSYLEEYIFKGYKHGVFMDIGAHDGVTFNNTLYFEKTNQWTGYNVEPIPTVYEKLKANRPSCVNVNYAVASTDGTAEFFCNSGYTEMLSGLKEHFDARHLDRLQKENQLMGSTTEVLTVPTKRIETICDEHHITHIHYLSIDVEGAEFDVIQSIPFDKVFIDVIGFENNYEDASIPIIQYLAKKKYVMIYKDSDIFMIHQDSMFYK